ncbi:sigma factor G inhibitor Gin [Paenibacillus sp. R14(2021)]|uniref:sigma factor G inhibitor Gin n=1 Tax=Paenibacillus sp. R14(2021) TaxID=2859228 RepID=UPI001C616493|nr:sigma factor G inhibitor Gin [Paenibacillus sp. R14(2021)]
MTEQPSSSACIICGHEKQEGIRIIDEFICESCESEMVRTEVQDAKYPFFIHQLRRIWLQNNA